MPEPDSARPVWLLIIVVATAVVVAVYAVDAATEIDGSARSVSRGVVLAAAALAAGACYQRWSIVPHRTPAHHAMAASALLGGALVASSAFSRGDGVFGNPFTAALGAVALVVALVAACTTLAVTKEPR